MSGGERRRLLLARTFLVGAGVLLLDEPGEHLDPQTADALVHDVLHGGSDESGGSDDGRPAVVVVTHRLAPLAAADEVIVLEAGGISARGSHAWLLANHAAYQDALASEQGIDPEQVASEQVDPEQVGPEQDTEQVPPSGAGHDGGPNEVSAG